MTRQRGDFRADLRFSQEMRDRFLTSFYGGFALQGRYVFVDKSRCSTILQKRIAIDTILQSKMGGSICIEEKIERRFTGNLALETDSCTVVGHESKGWMHYGQADYLLYAFVISQHQEPVGLDIYFMDFQALRAWFWKAWERFPERTLPDTHNHTRIRLVPIVEIGYAIGYFRYRAGATECQKVAIVSKREEGIA